MDPDSPAQQDLIAHGYEIGAETPPASEMDQNVVTQFPSMIGQIPLSATDPGQTSPDGELPPRVETSAWEEYRTLYMTVVHDTTAVARRLDNNFINGTKLLNVTGISRGRRDGILKQERVRHVVRMGTQNLKGVWIPFERAYALGKINNVCDRLYPLFLADLTPFLYEGNYRTRTLQEVQRARQRHPEFVNWINGVPRPPVGPVPLPQHLQIQAQEQQAEHQQRQRLDQYQQQHLQHPQHLQHRLQQPLQQHHQHHPHTQQSPHALHSQPQQLRPLIPSSGPAQAVAGPRPMSSLAPLTPGPPQQSIQQQPQQPQQMYQRLPRGPAQHMGGGQHRRQGSHRRTISRDTTPYGRPTRPQSVELGTPSSSTPYSMPMSEQLVEEEIEEYRPQQFYPDWQTRQPSNREGYMEEPYSSTDGRPKLEDNEFEETRGSDSE